MTTLFQTLLFLILYLLSLYLTGALFKKAFRLDAASLALTLAVGFVSYYALFQVVALPMILNFAALSALSIIWLAATAAIAVLAGLLCREEIARQIKGIGGALKALPRITWVAAAVVVFEIVLVGALGYRDGDDTYYIGNVTTALHTDTMFQVDPYTGMALSGLNYRYALAAYTMNNAVWCQWLGMHPLALMRTALPVALVLVSNFIYFEIGKQMFGGDRKKAMVFVAFVGVVEIFGFYSIYSAATFQLSRTAQGKAILGGEVMPLAFLLMMRIWKGGRKNADWIWMGILSLAAVAFTSTSFMVMPAALAAFTVAFAISRKDGRSIGKALLAMSPVFVMAGLYLMFAGGLALG